MGSLTRVNVTYLDLETYLEILNKTIFGTFMNGENIYNTNYHKRYYSFR